jgi:hypothetical protein
MGAIVADPTRSEALDPVVARIVQHYPLAA